MLATNAIHIVVEGGADVRGEREPVGVTGDIRAVAGEEIKLVAQELKAKP
jgi:hypothetical protein